MKRISHAPWVSCVKNALLALAFAIGIVASPSTLHAVTMIWDSDGTAPLSDGGGNWNAPAGGGTNWNPTNATTYGAWVSANDAIFGIGNGAAGTITVGAVSAPTLTFNAAGSGNYTLNSGTITLTGAASITTNVNATIGSSIQGTVGMAKSGTGTLTLTGTSTYTGATTVKLGTLTLNAATGALKNTSTLSMKGGVFNIDNVGAAGSVSQSLDALTFSAGDGTIMTTRTANQDEVLTFASLAARTAGATGNFVNGGGTNGATNGFVITGKAAGFMDVGIFYGGSAYAWYDSGGFVRAINYTTPDTGAVTSSGTTTLSGTTHQQITGAITAQNTAAFTTLNISGSNNFTLASAQTVTVNGILQSGSGVSIISGGTGIQAASGAEMVIRTDSAADALTISTPILVNGANALTKSGAGTLTLNAANTYTGVTYIDGGTLALANANALGGGGNITFGGGTLQYSAANTTDYSAKFANSTGAIAIDTNGQNVTLSSTLAATNTGGLVKTGAGTLTLATGTNAFTGGVSVLSGSLKAGATATFGSAATNSLYVASGATMDYNNLQFWITSFGGAGTIMNGNAMLVGGSGWTSTFSGNIANTKMDFRASGATLNLSGSLGLLNGSAFGWAAADPSTINLTGTLTTNIGQLTFGNQGLANLNVNGGLMNWTSPGSLLLASNGGNQNTPTMGIVTLTTGTISPQTAVFCNVNGVNALGVNSGNPYMSGTGILNLNGGLLITTSIYDTSTSPNSPMTLNLNGGTIQSYTGGNIFADKGYANELAVQIGSNGGTIKPAGFNIYSQRPLNNVSGAPTAGTLTVNGAGSLGLSGSGTYTGTTLINGGGTVKITNDGNLGAVPVSAVANQVELDGGTLNFSSCLSTVSLSGFASGSNATIATATVPNVGGSAVKVSNSILAITGGTGGSALAGVTVTIAPPDMPGGVQATAYAILSGSAITGYAMDNVGSGYSVAPAIWLGKTAGTFPTTNPTVAYYGLDNTIAPVIEAEGIVNGVVSVTLSGTDNAAGTLSATTTTSMSLAANRGIQIDAGGGTLDVSNNTPGFKATVNGAISGVGALTKSGLGTLLLTASNSYQGGTTITGGSLQLGNANALGATTGNLAINAGTLDLNGNNATVAALSGSTAGVITTSSNATSTLTVSSGTYAGSIKDGSGTMALTMMGSGTLTLSGSSSYSGLTSINGGLLAVSNTNGLGTGTISFGGGTLQYSGSNKTDYSARIASSSGAISIDTNSLNVTFASAIGSSNSGGFTKLGSGTLTLSGSNSYGGVTAINAGVLSLGNANALGAGNITFGGGTLQYSASNTTDYSAQIAGSGTNAIAIDTNGQGVIFANTIAGSNTGGLTVMGSGGLYLTGSQAYTGTTTISAGSSLQFGDGTNDLTSLASNSIVIGSTNASLWLAPVGTQTYAGSISGTGQVVLWATGTQILSGSNSYSGNTTLQSGTLSVANANALGTGTINFSGGTLQYNGITTDLSSRLVGSGGAIAIDTNGQNVNFASSLSGSYGLTKYGSGMLTLSASNGSLDASKASPITINGGTLKIGAGNTTPWSAASHTNISALVINNGTYDANGNTFWYGFVTGSAGGVFTNSSATAISCYIGGPTGSTGTFGGSFLNGVGTTSGLMNLMINTISGNLTLTGSSTVANFREWGTGTSPTITLAAGSYVSASLVSIGENSTGGVLNVNGGTLALQDPTMAKLLVGWNGNGALNLTSGTVTAPLVSRVGGSGSSSFINLTGGVLNSREIFNDYTSPAGAGITLTINGGKIVNTYANDTLFKVSGQSAGNELVVQIGNSGATIDTNGKDTSLQVPLADMAGQSGTLTKMGAGGLNLSGAATFTGKTLINGGTVRISADSNLGVISSPVANQVEINGGTLNFSAKLTGITLLTGSGATTTTAPNTNYTVAGVSGSSVFVKLDNGINAVTGGTGGTGITSAVVNFSAPDMAGGVQATGSANIVGGVITGYTITNPGSGYSHVPTMTLTGTGGTLPTVTGGNALAVGTYIMTGTPVIWSEGIVTGSAGLTISGYSSGGATASVTTSSSVSLDANRGIQIDAGGGTLDVSNAPTGFTATVNGAISGVGALTKSGSGTLVLTASNSYQGGTTVTGGSMQLANANALGATTGNLAVNAGTLDLNGNNATVGALSGSTAGVITTSSTAASTLASTSGSSSTYAGSINDGSGTTALIKDGAGALTLSGSSSNTGGLTVNGGSVIVSGQISGSQNVTVAASALLSATSVSMANFTMAAGRTLTVNGTLATGTGGGFTVAGTVIGTGTIGSMKLAATGVMAPGTDGTIGTIKTGAFDLSAGGLLKIDFQASDATTDLISAIGNVNLGTSAQLLLTNLSVGQTLTAGSTLTILNTTGGTISGWFTGANITISAGHTADMLTAVDGEKFTINYNVDSVLLTAVPEPSTWAMIVGGFGMLALGQKLRRRTNA